MDLFIRRSDRIDNLLSANDILADAVAGMVTVAEAMRVATGLGSLDGALYADDSDAECVYQLLGVDDVAQRRRAAAELVELLVHAEHVTDDELWSLMNACNVARLTLARRLGRLDETDMAPLPEIALEAFEQGFALLSLVVDQAARTLAPS